MAPGKRQSRSRRSHRRAAADCRRGRHRYGSAHYIGGGITRQTCSACGAVSIDVTAATPAGEKQGARVSPASERL